jgi:hypothetical protein
MEGLIEKNVAQSRQVGAGAVILNFNLFFVGLAGAPI